jgi:hypothetical protein
MAGEERDCCGKMFPSVITRPGNMTMAGKVFSHHIKQPGLMTTDRTVSVDQEAWRQCVACENFETCYRLSAGRQLLEIALSV